MRAHDTNYHALISESVNGYSYKYATKFTTHAKKGQLNGGLMIREIKGQTT